MRIIFFSCAFDRHRTLILHKEKQQLVQHGIFILVFVSVARKLRIYRRLVLLVEYCFDLFLEQGILCENLSIFLTEPITLESCSDPLWIDRYLRGTNYLFFSFFQ